MTFANISLAKPDETHSRARTHAPRGVALGACVEVEKQRFSVGKVEIRGLFWVLLRE